MEVTRASEQEVGSWFADIRGEISLDAESAQAAESKQSACVRKASKAITTTSCIDDVLNRKLRKKRKPAQLTGHGRPEAGDELDDESKIEAIKKPASSFSKATAPAQTQVLSKSARKRLKKKQKKNARNV